MNLKNPNDRPIFGRKNPVLQSKLSLDDFRKSTELIRNSSPVAKSVTSLRSKKANNGNYVLGDI